MRVKSSGMPRAVQNLQMPHPWDSQGGKMPHSSFFFFLGGGGGAVAGGIGWASGKAGIRNPE